MSNIFDPPPSPETPWEFYPDDDLREEPARAAEDATMHIENVDVLPGTPPPDDVPVVHYLDDEEPEIPDLSDPRTTNEETPEVEDLLIRQHYMAPDQED